MNSLREIGNFVGIPQGSLQVARYGGPWTTQLSKVSLLVTKRARPASMKAIIQALQNLTVAYTKTSDKASASATLARLEQVDSANSAIPKLREEIEKVGSK